MTRRHDSMIDHLLGRPWWVAVIVGALGYVVIALVPQLVLADGFILPVAGAFRGIALAWLGVCLVAGAGSAVRSYFVARHFERLRGLSDIREVSWRQFESLIGEGFRRRGFSVIETTQAGPDGGVDLVLHKDSKKFFVQCKQWKASKVGVKPVRELFGVIAARNAAGGFFVTSGEYTEEARAFARQTSLELLDGKALEQLILDARRPEPFIDPTVGRRHTSVRAMQAAPNCPKCHGAMVRRTAVRGATAGTDFWGCLQYPVCRGTRDDGEH
jgi:restriction system protein